MSYIKKYTQYEEKTINPTRNEDKKGITWKKLKFTKIWTIVMIKGTYCVYNQHKDFKNISGKEERNTKLTKFQAVKWYFS